jgi:TetR/AcrR family transcriptional repressor of nem operon
LAIQNTKARALAEAKELIQIYGYSAFTFQQVAEKLQIRQPSLYQHFKSKEDLGHQFILWYIEQFKEWSQVIHIFDPKSKVIALFETFYLFSNDAYKMCPLASLICDQNSFSPMMQEALNQLWVTQYTWLKGIISEGQQAKVFRSDKTAEELTNLVFAMAFGSQLTARIMKNTNQIKEIKEAVIKLLTNSLIEKYTK